MMKSANEELVSLTELHQLNVELLDEVNNPHYAHSTTLTSLLDNTFQTFTVQIKATGLSSADVDTLKNSLTDRVIDMLDTHAVMSLPQDASARLASSVVERSSEMSVGGAVFTPTYLNITVEWDKVIDEENRLDFFRELVSMLCESIQDAYGWELSHLYQYRNLPESAVEELQDACCITGVDVLLGKGGILEWCYTREDAEVLVDAMNKEPIRFTVFSIDPRY